MIPLYENHRSPWLNEELEMLKDAARRFFEREFKPHNERWLEQGEIDRDARNKAGEAGLLCAEMPERYGGAGGDYRHETVVMEEFLRLGLTGFGYQVHSSIVAPYILRYGNEEQRQRWLLPKMATGELVGAIAMTELHADLVIVVAKTDPSQGAKGISLIVVETAAPATWTNTKFQECTPTPGCRRSTAAPTRS